MTPITKDDVQAAYNWINGRLKEAEKLGVCSVPEFETIRATLTAHLSDELKLGPAKPFRDALVLARDVLSDYRSTIIQDGEYCESYNNDDVIDAIAAIDAVLNAAPVLPNETR